MRILSFNVNGLSSFSKYVESFFNINLNDYMRDNLKADIICMQETKGSKKKLEHFTMMSDFRLYFSHSKIRNGVSGVCIAISKKLYLKKVTTVIDTMREFCDEGRLILADFGNFRILNAYFPFFDEEMYNVKDIPEKAAKVMRFYRLFGEYVEINQDLILCGDFNSVYEVIDHYQFYREFLRIENSDNSQPRMLENNDCSIIKDIKQSNKKIENGNEIQPNIRNGKTDSMQSNLNLTDFENEKNNENIKNNNVFYKENEKMCKNDVQTENENLFSIITFRNKRPMKDAKEAKKMSYIVFENQTRIEKALRSSSELPFYFISKEELDKYLLEKEQRKWLRNFVNKGTHLDSFRYHNKELQKYTCWNQMKNHRPDNLGTRIDFIFVPLDFKNIMLGSDILTNVYGSDHCPVLLEIDLKVLQDKDNLLLKDKSIFSFFNVKNT